MLIQLANLINDVNPSRLRTSFGRKYYAARDATGLSIAYIIVEGLTGKICTFLLAELWFVLYYDMIV